MGKNQAVLRVYGPLNDFLKKNNRSGDFLVEFNGNPSVKDAVENIGIAHPEIEMILINGSPVNFNKKIRDGDRISVFPYMQEISKYLPEEVRLCKNHQGQFNFLVDVNLGKLVSYLRMTGFDTILPEDIIDSKIARQSVEEKRILLSRDIGLLKHKIVERGYWVRNNLPLGQLSEVLIYLNLFDCLHPFSRCLVCNRNIEKVEKESIEDLLDDEIIKYYHDFSICRFCNKIYWKGPHYRRMMGWIQNILEKSYKCPGEI